MTLPPLTGGSVPQPAPLTVVEPPARPGKSAQAPGQQAKVAVAAAEAAGIALPKNAQGMAASAIARGADPASIFAALVAPPEPPATEPPAADLPPTDAPAPDTPAAGATGEDPAPGADAPEDPPPAETPLDALETALALLEQET